MRRLRLHRLPCKVIWISRQAMKIFLFVVESSVVILTLGCLTTVLVLTVKTFVMSLRAYYEA